MAGSFQAFVQEMKLGACLNFEGGLPVAEVTCLIHRQGTYTGDRKGAPFQAGSQPKKVMRNATQDVSFVRGFTTAYVTYYASRSGRGNDLGYTGSPLVHVRLES